MKKISWVTHEDYDIPLPENHKFTASKFSDLYNELKNLDFYHRANILSPQKASVDELINTCFLRTENVCTMIKI